MADAVPERATQLVDLIPVMIQNDSSHSKCSEFIVSWFIFWD